MQSGVPAGPVRSCFLAWQTVIVFSCCVAFVVLTLRSFLWLVVCSCVLHMSVFIESVARVDDDHGDDGSVDDECCVRTF